MERPCLTKYLKPCNEVWLKNSRIIKTSTLAIRKSFELGDESMAVEMAGIKCETKSGVRLALKIQHSEK